LSSRVRRISIALGILLALGLLIGVASGDRLTGDDESTTTEAVATTTPEPERYPLATGTTPENVQITVYERAYSECASTEDALLASKYKAADTTPDGVAAVVGRAWASYFRAGPDAVQDGRDGCLQGQQDRSN
jgi:ABC-type Fe3+-hydroxamate transport system substrate-binding protein